MTVCLETQDRADVLQLLDASREYIGRERGTALQGPEADVEATWAELTEASSPEDPDQVRN